MTSTYSPLRAGRSLVLRRAANLWNSGERAGSIVVLSRYLEHLPSDTGAWIGLGSRLVRLRQRQPALEAFRMALDADPLSRRAWEMVLAFTELDAATRGRLVDRLAARMAASPDDQRLALFIFVHTRHALGLERSLSAGDHVTRVGATVHAAQGACLTADIGARPGVASREERTATVIVLLALRRYLSAAQVLRSLQPSEFPPIECLRIAIRWASLEDDPAAVAALATQYLRTLPDDAWASRKRAEARRAAQCRHAGPAAVSVQDRTVRPHRKRSTGQSELPRGPHVKVSS